MFQYENDWGNLREAGLIHETLHLKIVGESRSSKCHFVSWWTLKALLTLKQSWTFKTECTAHQNVATIVKCTDPLCVKEQSAMALIQP